jgi:predicted metalloprotease
MDFGRDAILIGLMTGYTASQRSWPPLTATTGWDRGDITIWLLEHQENWHRSCCLKDHESLIGTITGFASRIMRWQDLRRSENVEDRRRVTPAGVAVGGGIGTLIFVVVAILLGADPQKIFNLLQDNPAAVQQQPGAPANPQAGDPDAEQVDFVKAVLGDTEDVWQDLFRRMGNTYRDPHLELFTGHTSTGGCGFASSAVGPFYCPPDEKVYIDLDFFRLLERRFHAPGEFARAYVIAHEVGHHVQNLLGISESVRARQRRMSEVEAKKLSVRLELQADFLAGVWAHHAQRSRQILERGDVEAALRAASAIGDDRLEMESQGYVVPDSFTHGTSEQRVRWFRRGLRTGDINQGDTFAVPAESL